MADYDPSDPLAATMAAINEDQRLTRLLQNAEIGNDQQNALRAKLMEHHLDASTVGDLTPDDIQGMGLPLGLAVLMRRLVAKAKNETAGNDTGSPANEPLSNADLAFLRERIKMLRLFDRFSKPAYPKPNLELGTPPAPAPPFAYFI